MKEKKKFGPKNLDTGSRLFRIEYAVISLGILAYSIWIAIYGQGLDILQFIFWGVFPDLVAFIPIGLAMKKTKKWPSWGSNLYNSVHHVGLWAIVFVALLVILQRPNWALLGWIFHINVDRAVNYSLRQSS